MSREVGDGEVVHPHNHKLPSYDASEKKGHERKKNAIYLAQQKKQLEASKEQLSFVSVEKVLDSKARAIKINT